MLAADASVIFDPTPFEPPVNNSGDEFEFASFDWLPGSTLVQDFDLMSTGAPDAVTGDLLFQTSLNSFIDESSASIPHIGTAATDGGLGVNYEVTLVARYTVQWSDTDGNGAGDTLTLAPTQSADAFGFRMYYDTTINTNALEGTGYDDGNLIMEGTINDHNGVLVSLGPHPTNPALDQVGTDNDWGNGMPDFATSLWVTGGFSTTSTATAVNVDGNFLLDSATGSVLEAKSFDSLLTSGNYSAPFDSVDPAKKFFANDPTDIGLAEYDAFAGMGGVDAVNLGTTALGVGVGAAGDGTDGMFQSDASTSFTMATSTIHGFKFEDYNNNGVYEPEADLDGDGVNDVDLNPKVDGDQFDTPWLPTTINGRPRPPIEFQLLADFDDPSTPLVNEGGDGVYDLVATTMTDASGEFWFDVECSGEYLIRELLPNAEVMASTAQEFLITVEAGYSYVPFASSGVSGASATVTARQTFYNNSAFDGNGSSVADGVDNVSAVDPTKSAFLGVGTANGANITNYVNGINGIVVDITGAAGPLTAADFSFSMGTTQDTTGTGTSDWTTVPAADVTVTSVSIAGGQQALIAFTDGLIVDKWLQVVVHANANTQLPIDDIHYWGNKVGDSSGDGIVASADTTQTFTDFGSTPRPVDWTTDFNKDGFTAAADTTIVFTEFATSLEFLDAAHAEWAERDRNTYAGDPDCEVVDERLAFGNYVKGSVHGFKFEDYNGDGIYDPDGDDDIAGNADDDLPWSGFEFVLWQDVDGDGEVTTGVDISVGTQFSNDDGEFWFTGLVPGDYVLVETEVYDYDGDGMDDDAWNQIIAKTSTERCLQIGSGEEWVWAAGAAMLDADALQHEVIVDSGSGTVTGTAPYVVFVVDVSGSTTSPSGVDIDGDSVIDSILDVELEVIRLLVEDLATIYGSDAHVGIVSFSSGAGTVDMDLTTPGVQTFVTADALSGAPISAVLATVGSAGGTGATDYDDALALAEANLQTVFPGTPPPDPNANVIFLSDGAPSGGYASELASLTDTAGNIRAIGVGAGASDTDITIVEMADGNPDDAIFLTSADDIMDFFDAGGTGAGTVVPGGALIFGNAVLGSIHGFKYEDVDADGAYDPSIDLPYANIPFSLMDANGNVIGDPATGEEYVLTDAAGEFWFTKLMPGQYTVVERVDLFDTLLGPGVTPSTAIESDIFVGSREEHVWQDGAAGLMAGGAAAGDFREEVLTDPDGDGYGQNLMFGNYVTGSIHGFKFEDYNGDGVYDPDGADDIAGNTDDDIPWAGFEFQLWLDDGDGVYDAMLDTQVDLNGDAVIDSADSQFSDDNGEFWFTSLLPGESYFVVETGLYDADGDGIDDDPYNQIVAKTPTVSGVIEVNGREEHVWRPGAAMLPDPTEKFEVFADPDGNGYDENLMFGNAVLGSIHGYKCEDLDADGVCDGSDMAGPNMLDIVFVVDTSGGFDDDIATFQIQASAILAGIQGIVPDSQFGLVSFEDFPIDPYGDGTDLPYEAGLMPLDGSAANMMTAIGNLVLGSGGDILESQYAALWGALGNDHDGNGDGDLLDPEDFTAVAPGFRPGAEKIFILWTDYEFHDSDTDASYPGPGATATTNALVAAGVSVVGVSSGGGGMTQLNALATATGAVDNLGNPLVYSVGTDGTGIATAIVEGITGIVDDDPAFPGIPFSLFDADGNNVTPGADGYVLTDANGEFWFDGLMPGTYTVQERSDLFDTLYPNDEIMSSGDSSYTLVVGSGEEHVWTEGAAGLDATDPFEHRIEITPDDGLVFENYVKGSIHGFKFHDVDQDGLYDPAAGDEPFKGVVFDLYADLDGDGTYENHRQLEETFDSGSVAIDGLTNTGTYNGFTTTSTDPDGTPDPDDLWTVSGGMAMSGDLNSNETSTITTTVNGFGYIAFDWTVSSEAGYDGLTFFIDGVAQDLHPLTPAFDGFVSGTDSDSVWYQITTAGTHTLEWVYSKDAFASSGADKATLDNVVFYDSSDANGEFWYTSLIPGDYVVAEYPDAFTSFAGEVMSTSHMGNDEFDDGVLGAAIVQEVTIRSRQEHVWAPGAAMLPGDLDGDGLVDDNDANGDGLPDVLREEVLNTDLAFGNFIKGSIHGFKFEDYNANGIYEPQGDLDPYLPGTQSDTPWAGFEIELYSDDDGDGLLTVEDVGAGIVGDALVGSMFTDANGEFWFTGLLPGDYIVVETESFDLDGDGIIDVESGDEVKASTSTQRLVTVGSGEELVWTPGAAMLAPLTNPMPKHEVLIDPDGSGWNENLMFGNYVEGSIHGFKFEDYDGDGIFDISDDVAFGDIPFDLYYTDPATGVETLVASEASAYDGKFWFTDLRPGAYRVVENTGSLTWADEVMPSDVGDRTFFVGSRHELVYKDGEAMIPADSLKTEINVSYAAGVVDPTVNDVVTGNDLRYGNVVKGSIHGFKCEDVNGDQACDTTAQLVYVIDASGSMSATDVNFAVGDVDGDGVFNSKLDLELAILFNSLVDLQSYASTLPDNAAFLVSVVVMQNGAAFTVDLDPSTPGLSASPDSVLISDVIGEIAAGAGFFSPYAFGDSDLQSGIDEAVLQLGNLNSKPHTGNVVYLSDGYDNSGTLPLDASGLVPLADNIQAYGVGNDALLSTLSAIDPDAVLVTTDIAGSGYSIFPTNHPDFNGPEMPQAGVEFVLTGTTMMGGTLTSVGPISVMTDANGEFWFEQLYPGNYTVTEVLPAGQYSTTGTTWSHFIGSGEEYAWAVGEASLMPGLHTEKVDSGLIFGNYTPVPFSGLKFNDLNANGINDGEPGMGGIQFVLEDSDGNILATDISDFLGNFDFNLAADELAPGTYTVYEIIVDADGDGIPDIVSTTSDSITFTVESGDAPVALEFGNTILGSLHGFKFEDYDGNGTYEGFVDTLLNVDTDGDGIDDATDGLSDVDLNSFLAGEQFDTPWVNFPFEITGDTDGDGAIESITVWTDADGEWDVVNLWPGTYTIREALELVDSDIYPTTHSSGSYAVTIESGQELVYDWGAADLTAHIDPQHEVKNEQLSFGNAITGSLHGCVFLDGNSNGIQEAGQSPPEGAVGGVVVQLLDGSGTVIDSMTTLSDGLFNFTDLPVGDYSVSIDPASITGHTVSTTNAYFVGSGEELVHENGAANLGAGDLQHEVNVSDATWTGDGLLVGVAPGSPAPTSYEATANDQIQDETAPLDLAEFREQIKDIGFVRELSNLAFESFGREYNDRDSLFDATETEGEELLESLAYELATQLG